MPGSDTIKGTQLGMVTLVACATWLGVSAAVWHKYAGGVGTGALNWALLGGFLCGLVVWIVSVWAFGGLPERRALPRRTHK